MFHILNIKVVYFLFFVAIELNNSININIFCSNYLYGNYTGCLALFFVLQS